MTSFDYAVFIIIGLCIIVSMMRGAVREILSIIGWVAAFYVARTYVAQLIPLLPQDIPTDALRVLAGFLILFFGVLLVFSLLSIALSSMIKKIGLSWLNRFFGALFGFAKGLIIVCILVFLAGLTSLPKDIRWTNAMFSSPLEALVKATLPWVPQKVAQHVKYD
ncbi:MAG: colicin V production protein [Methylotenera sp.]|nr:MAG: colicin V production protein [Methylotenera sp.]